MTYSLNTLNASPGDKSAARPAGPRFGHEMSLLAGLLVLVFWLLALLSYSPQDPAWSTSGAGAAPLVRNWAGRVGAWAFMLGLHGGIALAAGAWMAWRQRNWHVRANREAQA